MENKFVHKDDIIRLRERTIEELQSELAAAHARISELERCVVMGGDGKPIGIGSKGYVRAYNRNAVIETLPGEVLDMHSYIDARDNEQDTILQVFLPHWVSCYQVTSSQFYSSADSVPEGDKE